jgi:hypothetical protein
VRSGDVERRVFFAEGNVSTATSSDPAESLAAGLVEDGLVDPLEVESVAAHVKATRRDYSFGKQLVRLNLVDEVRLRRSERQRVIAVVEKVLALRTGEYRVEAGAVAGDALPPQMFDVPRLVATGVLKGWDDAWALDAVGGERAVLDIVPERLADYEATDAEEVYDLTLLRVNGQRCVREVVEMSPLPTRAALRFLAAARLLDCLRLVRPDPATEPEPAPPARPPSPVDPDAALAQAAVAPAPLPAEAKTLSARSARTAGSGAAATGAAAAAPQRRVVRGWLVVLLAVVLGACLAWFGYQGWKRLASPARSAPATPASGTAAPP